MDHPRVFEKGPFMSVQAAQDSPTFGRNQWPVGWSPPRRDEFFYGNLGVGKEQPKKRLNPKSGTNKRVYWSRDGPSMVVSLRSVTVSLRGEVLNSPNVQIREK